MSTSHFSRIARQLYKQHFYLSIMETKIYASWLSAHGYCEYKFYLQYVECIEVPMTFEMQAGSEIHESKEEDFLKEAKPATWDDFLNSTHYTITKEVSLQTKFENSFLIGKVDEVAVDRDAVYIIEDKPGAMAYDGVKNQIYAYCYLFKRNFSDKNSKPIYAILRDRDSNIEVWKEAFTLKNEFTLQNRLNRIKKILKKEIDPVSTDNKKKCMACIMHKFNLCKHSLAR